MMMYQAFGKRCDDLLIGISGLVLLSPLILVLVVLILIFDPGPVVFKQERIGVGGERFLFYKFRSMPVNTASLPSGQLGTIKRTWIGNIIRITNLDKLPQLFNIIKGDMSLVGPRPPIPSQAALIDYRRKNSALQCRRRLTGLAQVNSYDGMSSTEKAVFDGRYANNVSLVGDIKIVLSTFRYLLK